MHGADTQERKGIPHAQAAALPPLNSTLARDVLARTYAPLLYSEAILVALNVVLVQVRVLLLLCVRIRCHDAKCLSSRTVSLSLTGHWLNVTPGVPAPCRHKRACRVLHCAVHEGRRRRGGRRVPDQSRLGCCTELW